MNEQNDPVGRVTLFAVAIFFAFGFGVTYYRPFLSGLRKSFDEKLAYKMLLKHYVGVIFALPILAVLTHCEENGYKMFKIDGRVSIPNTQDSEWISKTRVLVDGGDHLGFLRSDGSFTVSNIAHGSYIVEVIHPMFVFEPVRVDVNSKGKMRARRLNLVNPSAVDSLAYPLKFKAKGRASYFQQREQWRITDFLFSPMVMMMVLPLLVMLVIPKLINSEDPDMQKQMQNSMNFLNPKQGMPDMSEMLTKLLGGKTPQKPKAIKNKNKKR